jgi:hypothetical protein
MGDRPTASGPPNPDESAERTEGLDAQLEEFRADLSRERRARLLLDSSTPSEWRAWVVLGSGVVGVALAVVFGIVAKAVTGMIVLLTLQGLVFGVWGTVRVVRAREQRRRGATARRRERPAAESGRFWEE